MSSDVAAYRQAEGLGIDRAHVVASSFGGHLALRSVAASGPHRLVLTYVFLAAVVVAGQLLAGRDVQP